jgi:hypothetical protein
VWGFTFAWMLCTSTALPVTYATRISI